MGSTASKSARSYAKAKPPTWTGARNDLVKNAGVPRASETKTTAIRADARDPHLLANLGKMGQVHVPSASATVTPQSTTLTSFNARQLSESEAASDVPIRNRILASTLTDLLDERKSLPPQDADSKLSHKFNIDVSLLDRLTRHINSPSSGESVVSRIASADGEQPILSKAAWVDPKHALHIDQ